jgi:carboxypeptidase C (cathepsin A)
MQEIPDMKKTLMSLVMIALLQATFSVTARAAFSQAKPDTTASEIPKAEKSVTRHTVTVDGQKIDYTATAGTIILRNDQGEPIALFGYTAYTKDGVKNPANRPITFSYNGGPGSSSIWLHMGVMGPRRVVLKDPEATPPAPYELTDNQYSMLDATDIVMVDPVGTGLSRAVGKSKNKDFWGVDQDISSVSNFIKSYISANNRWNSPKYLLGESYGTTRSAGIADYLQQREGIALNGIVLVSTVLDLRTIAFGDADNLPYEIYLPTYAAVAWYHDQLANKPEDLEGFLGEARRFASHEYAQALMQGDELPQSQHSEVINKLAYFTGLSKDYIDRADLRITEPEFAKELLRKEGKTVGRLDSRYVGYSMDNLSQGARYDPQSTAISPAFTTMFFKYYHEELQFGQDKQYHVSAYSLPDFDWDWKRRGGSFFPTSPTTAPDLAEAMTKNPNLKVLVLNGYFDLATPFMGAEYTMDHLDIPKELESNISMKYYHSGHMIYIHKSSLEKMHNDVDTFIQNTNHK